MIRDKYGRVINVLRELAYDQIDNAFQAFNGQFHMSRFPTAQAQFNAVARAHPEFFPNVEVA